MKSKVLIAWNDLYLLLLHLFSLLHRFSSGSLLQATFLALLLPSLTPFPSRSSLLPLHFPLLPLIMLGILIDVHIFHIV